MIVTITPAPAIDWTVAVDSFELDGVNRIVAESREASGKGLNVSWALHRAGIPTMAIFPAGAQTGAFMRDELIGAGLAHRIVDTGRDVRTNIALVSPGHATKINEPGAVMDRSHVEDLRSAILDACHEGDVALFCGSLPPGMGDSFAAHVVEDLHAQGVPTIVDSSGGPLRASLPAHPRMIKPNVHELADLVERTITTLGDVEAACHLAMDRGAKTVLASLGSDGAMFVSPSVAAVARADGVVCVNSVGAGDALLSGFVAGGPTPQDRLFNAVLWASSAVSHETTLFPILPELADRITVTSDFPRDESLTEPSQALTPTP
jgi:1-phosphofructokinase